MSTAIECTTLYKAMIASGNYSPDDAIEAIAEMRALVATGEEDPEELLHYEGFEPDYIFDIID